MSFTGDGSLGAGLDLLAAEAARQPAPPPPRRPSRWVREAPFAYLLVLPSLVVLGVFVVYPLARDVYLGFYRTSSSGVPTRYVGFAQYRAVLTSRSFVHSVEATVAFALMTVPVGAAIGVALGLLAHRRLRGAGLFRAAFSSTVAVSLAVAAVIFGSFMSPAAGLLPWLGLQTTPPLLDNPDWALPAVAVTTIWQTLGVTFVLVSAGLGAIPAELLEAAELDGAGAWRRFWRVTFPLLSPTILFAVVVESVFAFQSFAQIDLLTRGGPGQRTNVLGASIVYALRGRTPDPGRAAVLALVLFAITLVLTVLPLRFLERRTGDAR